jgi:hypothetical protein
VGGSSGGVVWPFADDRCVRFFAFICAVC